VYTKIVPSKVHTHTTGTPHTAGTRGLKMSTSQTQTARAEYLANVAKKIATETAELVDTAKRAERARQDAKQAKHDKLTAKRRAERHKRVLETVHHLMRQQHSRACRLSCRALAEHTGTTKNTASQTLNELISLGMLERVSAQYYTITSKGTKRLKRLKIVSVSDTASVYGTALLEQSAWQRLRLEHLRTRHSAERAEYRAKHRHRYQPAHCRQPSRVPYQAQAA